MASYACRAGQGYHNTPTEAIGLDKVIRTPNGSHHVTQATVAHPVAQDTGAHAAIVNQT